MLIWTGKGFLIAGLIFGCSLVANLVTNSLSGGGHYWDTHRWTFGLAMLSSALLVFPLGIFLSHDGVRTFIDKETGEEVRVGGDHSLFFIQARWWWAIQAILGFGVIIHDLVL